MCETLRSGEMRGRHDPGVVDVVEELLDLELRSRQRRHHTMFNSGAVPQIDQDGLVNRLSQVCFGDAALCGEGPPERLNLPDSCENEGAGATSSLGDGRWPERPWTPLLTARCPEPNKSTTTNSPSTRRPTFRTRCSPKAVVVVVVVSSS